MISDLWYIGIGIAICYYGFLFILEWQFRKEKDHTHTLRHPKTDLPIASLNDIDQEDDVEDFRYNPIFKTENINQEEEIDKEVSLRVIKTQKTV